MNVWRKLSFWYVAAALCIGHLSSAGSAQPPATHALGPYEQQFAGRFTASEGAPKDPLAVVVGPDGAIYAGGPSGLFRRAEKSFAPVEALAGAPVQALAASAQFVFAATDKGIFRISGADAAQAWDLPEAPAEARRARGLAVIDSPIPRALLATPAGLFAGIRRNFIPVESLNSMLGENKSLASVAATAEGRIAVAGAAGLFVSDDQETWRRLFPGEGSRSWAPADARAVAFDSAGRLWFASPQGAGRYDLKANTWKLLAVEDGLPYDDFTSLAPGRGDEIWFGTRIGAIRFDGKNWEYRQGRAWLPGDEVRALAVAPSGAAWFATDGGLGSIEPRKVTLAEKAKFFEEQVDRYHRRTPFEYVDSVSLEKPGDPEGGFKQRDSDNDGLWTSMYGAGECFAWAATKDPKARERAVKAFKALQFLGRVTQGGEHAPPPGYVARTILPTDGPDPNIGRLDQDRREQAEGDKLWKVIDPRWPKSADGKWYWKCDTSSDELDGHYFFYAAYYDLVAATDAEKAQVREVVTALTDHLIAHGFNLVDHDGKPTRWARFSPEEMNHSKDWWEERGLNSLSMLSYLKVAEHVSGDAKYAETARKLMDDHAYKMNVMNPKQQLGPGTGNQSDDEMGFMGFYNLLRYEKDPELRQLWTLAFHRYWLLERPERNPLFSFMYVAAWGGEAYHDAFGRMDLSPSEDWLPDSVDTLERYPWDRVDWGRKNSHRKDVIPVGGGRGRRGARGTRLDGKVLPVDERVLDQWNHDPWHLDHGGRGGELLVPTSFLLPYYMGLHYGFLVEARRQAVNN